MRQYERSSITIDQCTECRGIFLDRGELEKLIDGEAAWSQGQARSAPQPAAPPPPRVQQGYPAPAYEQQQYGYHGHTRQRKRKGGFLGELFD